MLEWLHGGNNWGDHKEARGRWDDHPMWRWILLVGYNNDPVLGPFIKRSTTLADLINSNATSQLSASQSQPSSCSRYHLHLSHPQLPPLSRTLKNHFLLLNCGLDIFGWWKWWCGIWFWSPSWRQIPWQSHGLQHLWSHPALWALKNIEEEEDLEAFQQQFEAWEIFDLGIKALESQRGSRSESSGGMITAKGPTPWDLVPPITKIKAQEEEVHGNRFWSLHCLCAWFSLPPPKAKGKPYLQLKWL